MEDGRNRPRRASRHHLCFDSCFVFANIGWGSGIRDKGPGSHSRNGDECGDGIQAEDRGAACCVVCDNAQGVGCYPTKASPKKRRLLRQFLQAVPPVRGALHEGVRGSLPFPQATRQSDAEPVKSAGDASRGSNRQDAKSVDAQLLGAWSTTSRRTSVTASRGGRGEEGRQQG